MNNDNLIKDLILNLSKSKYIDIAIDTIVNIKKQLELRGSEINTETIKIFWNYSEINVDEYSFNELLSWVKENIPSNIKRACVYKDTLGTLIQLHICYFNENDEPILNGDFPHLVVNTLSLDNVLSEKFGDKDMLVLG